jgi:tRNA(Ile)-lysidine synthase
MRMINGHRMQGLMGIKGCSEIPECYGIHGVHESGGIDDRSSRDSLNITQSPSGRNPVSQLRTETGGAKVYRPLLGFNKTRLIATCQALDIEWFEDLTNKDPTLTTRNAIRHMYNSHAMPASLSKTSILALSDRFKEKAESQQNEMNSWLAQSKITRFETRSGILGIRFPGLSHLRSSSGEGTGRDYEQVAAGLLRRVIMLVTPEENVHLSTLHGAAKHLFAELFMDHEVHYQPTKFTVTGVQFDPIKTSDGRYAKPEWLLSRQPHSSPPSSRPLILIPPCTSISTSRPSNPLWTPWTFYDNRYWIRLQNLTLTTLLIRPFSKDDLKPFQESLPKADRDRLRSIFKEIAPGDVRWTLPAVVMRGRYGCEKVQCLPTLDVCRVEAGRMVKWEVRYKKVDVAELPMP